MRGQRLGIVGLLAANGISMSGTSMSMLALPWFVLATTGSAMDTGLVALAEMLPYVLVQAFGGPLVDRLGARRMSIATDVAAALAMGAVPVLHAAGLLGLAPLSTVVAVAGACRGAGDIARRVLLPRICQPAGLPLDRASGLYDGINRVAALIGGPLGGLLIALSSAPIVLALDATSFAASALVIAICTAAEGGSQGRSEAKAPSYLADLKEGFSRLGRDRLLVGIGAMIIVTNLLDQAFASVLMPLWVKSELGSPLALGSISACFGIGAVAGNALLAWLAPRLPRRLPFALSFLVCGAPRFLVMAIASTLGPVAIVAIASGLGAGGINPVLGAVEYERVPRALQARVLGALGSLAWAGIPFGGLVGGALAGSLGLRTALAICGLAYLLATLAPFVFPVWREMERGRSAA